MRRMDGPAQQHPHTTLSKQAGTLLAVASMLGSLIVVYADGVARDRTAELRMTRQEQDTAKLERDVKELRGEIRQDLSEIKSDVRALRNGGGR